MKAKFLKINGIDLKFYLWGNSQKPKLFLFHGWLDTGAGFEFLVEHLQDRFHCIAPDMRGYGQSGHSKNPLGYFFYEYVADAHAIFEALAPEEPLRLLGHSLGGAVASVYAGTFPERVSHLINVEGYQIPLRDPETAPDRARRWIEGLRIQRFRTFPSLEKFADRLRQSNPGLPPDRARFLARHLTKKVRGGYKMAADPKHKLVEPYLMSLPVFEAFWRRIPRPVLLVASEFTERTGRFNVFDDPSMERKIPSRFPPGTKKVVIPEAGHMIHHERPEVLAEEVLRFL